MKIKQSFVSNSSSTSFLILGFVPTQEEADKYFQIGSDEHFEKYLYDVTAKQPIIGKILQTHSDNEMWTNDSKSLSLDQIKNTMDRIQTFFYCKCGTFISYDRIKLFYGVRQ